MILNGSLEWALRGSNPRPHGCDTSGGPTQPTIQSTDTPTPSDVCTPVCTNSAKTTKPTDLDTLAAVLLALSPDERVKLAMMLHNHSGADAPVFG
jgi:hypothetical protein